MHKNDLINRVAVETGVPRVVAARVVNSTLETIVDEIAEGRKVVLTGFGTFELRRRRQRRGVDPRTAAEITVPATETPGFTASATFKGRIREASER